MESPVDNSLQAVMAALVNASAYEEAAHLLAEAAPQAGDLPSAFDLASGITSENLRLQTLVALVQRASEADPTLVSTYWSGTLRLASRLARPRFLEHLQALADVLHTLGGAEAIVEARRAVEDVGRWWP